MVIIRLIDEERLGVWMLASNNISHTIFVNYMFDEIEKIYGMRSSVAEYLVLKTHLGFVN